MNNQRSFPIVAPLLFRGLTQLFFYILLLFVLSCKTEVGKFYNNQISIVPYPTVMEIKEGAFDLNDKTVLVIPDSLEIDSLIALFLQKVRSATGFELRVAMKAPSSNYIEYVQSPNCNFNQEGYVLKVNHDRIVIDAATEAGFFYATQTIIQLLPAEIEKTTVSKATWRVPCVHISDKPRFPWRGMHLDVCRHFIPVEDIKKHLDMMAKYKLNTFHWHLTEDQAWRIEIKKYPRLTEIGSKRTEDDGTIIQGFYTQEQIREVVEYAKQRCINIVPEIEMPGHALAALAGYPQYSCAGDSFSPRTVWGVEEDVYCAGNDETFVFLEHIIDEVVALFPYEYFHIGGDECPKTRWKNCAKCQKRIRAEGLKDEHELQSYFIKRIEKVLLNHKKKMIGWDEILEGGLAQSAAVMSWRGEQGGIDAALQGHDVVMTPGSHCYLDHYQGSSKVEPVAIGGYSTLEKVYEYDPVPAMLDDHFKKHVLGTQGNVWTEYMYSPDRVEYFVYPRILALAEVAWTLPLRKDFQDFMQRLNNHFVRMDLKGINYHIPLPEGPCDFVAFVDSASLTFTNTLNIDMVYTLDGALPNALSARYDSAIVIKNNAIVRIASLLETGKMSPVRTIRVEKQKYAFAEDFDNLNDGIRAQTAMGYFSEVSELDTVSRWQNTVVKAFQLKSFFNYKKPSAAIFEAFIVISEDNVYRFSTDVDQLYVNGKLLVSNEKEVKKHSRNDASVALAKGLHRVKMVVLNNVTGGWPLAWSGVELRYKKLTESEFKVVNSYKYQEQ